MLISHLTEDRSDFPLIPQQNQQFYDDDSGLFMNPPSQWSKSPYLGAVKIGGDGYIAQAHIPQAVWSAVIQDNPKWHNVLPDGFFNAKGTNRSPIRVARTKDPRQAAWIVQSLLYGHEDFGDLLDDYLTLKYIEGQPGIGAFKDALRDLPKFEGEALTVADADSWIQDQKTRQAAQQKVDNAPRYEAQMTKKIVAAFVEAMRPGSLRKKVFGKSKMSLTQVSQAVTMAVKELGVEHFVTAPGSIKIKPPETFNLSSFI